MENIFKEVVIKDRTWRINKFDAKTGSFILIKLTGLLAPLIDGVDLNNIKVDTEFKAENVDLSQFNISGLIKGISQLSEQDFFYIQDKCLNVCGEVLPSGITKVLSQNGTFGVLGLEQDTMAVIALMAHTLMFNLTGFFGESLLSSIVQKVSSTSQQDAKI